MKHYQISKTDFLLKCKKIQAIATDVDGVLNDGLIMLDQHNNETAARFSTVDGLGAVIAHDCGLKIIVISGRKSLCTENRCASLNITEVYTGIANKSKQLQNVAKKLKLNMTNILYIGDDLIDLKVMNMVGLKVAPKNAQKVILQNADYITHSSGGQGVLREVVNLVIQAQGKLEQCINKYL